MLIRYLKWWCHQARPNDGQTIDDHKTRKTKKTLKKNDIFRQSLLLLLLLLRHIGVTHAADVVLPCSRQYIEESRTSEKKNKKTNPWLLYPVLLPSSCLLHIPQKEKKKKKGKEEEELCVDILGIDDNTVRPTGDTVSWWCKSFGAADVIFSYIIRAPQPHLKGKRGSTPQKMLLLLFLLSTMYTTSHTDVKIHFPYYT